MVSFFQIQISGCFFLWGNISPYIVTILRGKIEKTDLISVNAVFCVFWASFLLAIPLGPYLMRKTAAWTVILISAVLTCGGMFLSAITQEYWLFIFFLGLCSGGGLGLSYMSTIVICFEFFPH